MNIWQWVNDTQTALREQGQHRLADLIDEIPGHVAGGRKELAQAALPEALAAARALQHPWLEVFFRHWVINHRVCSNKEGEAALKDTVALFEYAHRPEAIECPQTVCTTQDIASCYGNVDGPGYAQERIAVCEETLARIDPSWGCYNCISRELIEALGDAGRGDDAVALAERQLPILRDAGSWLGATYYVTQARAHFNAGDFEETIKLLAFIEEQQFGDDNGRYRYSRDCLRFHALARAGMASQAWDALPSEADGTEHDESLDLAAGMEAVFAILPQHNTHVAGRRAGAALRRYDKAGAHRLTLDTAGHCIRMAVARGARWHAMQALALARPHLAKLRAPLGAPEQFAALEALVAAMPESLPLPVAPELLAEYVREGAGDMPEQDLEWLLVAAGQLPDDAALAVCVAEAMQACGAQREASDYLWQFVRKHPEMRATGVELLWVSLQLQDHAGVMELAQMVSEVDPVLSHWCRARLAFVTQSWLAVGEHVGRLLDIEPESHRAKALWADAAMRAKQFDVALRLRLELAGRDAEKGNIDWDAIVAASAAGRWDLVRTFAAKLELKLSGTEGVVEEPWEIVRVRTFEDNEWVERYARRTGPATARIRSMARPGSEQHLRDWVVFDPLPMQPLPEGEDADTFVELYDQVHVLEPGNFGSGFLLDGAHPGDEQLAGMTDALDELDWEWLIRSDDDYTVTGPEAEERLRGVYFSVAAPVNVSATQVDAKLVELSAGFAHPLCWPELAAAAGVDPASHWDIVERYGL